MTELITLTLGGTLLVSGQLWFVLAMLSFKLFDYHKALDFFLSKGGAVQEARNEQLRRKGKAQNAHVAVTVRQPPRTERTRASDVETNQEIE